MKYMIIDYRLSIVESAHIGFSIIYNPKSIIGSMGGKTL
jgi:hypothetical protein